MKIYLAGQTTPTVEKGAFIAHGRRLISFWEIINGSEKKVFDRHLKAKKRRLRNAKKAKEK